MDKTYYKRKGKKNESFEDQIKDNINGLYNYFTAPNIRNKVFLNYL